MGKFDSEIVDRLLKTGSVNFARMSDDKLAETQRCLAGQSDELIGNSARHEEFAKLNKWSLAFKDEIAARQNRSASGKAAVSEAPHFELVAQCDGSANDDESLVLDNVVNIDAAHHQPAVPDDEQLELRLAVNA